MFRETMLFDSPIGTQITTLSVAQLADIQDELYRIQEMVRDHPVAGARIRQLIKKLDAMSSKPPHWYSVREAEEECDHMVGLSKLMMQAQQQCQQ
ncbi:MAG: hypothetical protein HC884_01380 [Chloroflexaceae bacterium]|nr:hypothetical protein [Chloroflexaceae bacterium]